MHTQAHIYEHISSSQCVLSHLNLQQDWLSDLVLFNPVKALANQFKTHQIWLSILRFSAFVQDVAWTQEASNVREDP